MRLPKELQPLAKAARRQGWTIEITRGNHLVWTSPAGAKVFTSKSPSEYRAVHNAINDLRQKGLKY